MLTWAVLYLAPETTLYISANERAICQVSFADDIVVHGSSRANDNPVIREAASQLSAYFEGRLRTFDLPLEMTGTPFQLKVWEALRTIPYGATLSYAELASRVGSPRGFRAVGAANGKNPIPIIVPCHRVIESNGRLGGFSCGVAYKRRLLELEFNHSIV